MGRRKAEKPTGDIYGRVTVINLKGSQEQRDYMEALTRKTMIPASRIVRAAINEWAKRNGHGPFPGAGD